MNNTKVDDARDSLLFILKLACCLLFGARAWLYLNHLGPMSAFFWHQEWLEGPLENWFGLPWVDYAMFSEPLILRVQNLMGALFAVCAVACWWVRPNRRYWVNGIVWSGAIVMLPYWLLRWVDHNYQAPMLLEHFLQWGTPVLLLTYGRISARGWLGVAATFTAATFVGHGLYAIGWTVPRSNDFVNMTMSLLNFSEGDAKAFLNLAAIMDFLTAALLLWPLLRKQALAYMCFWGIATAMARVISHYTPAENYYGLHPWLAETIVRLPHGIVPLAMLLLVLQYQVAKSTRPAPIVDGKLPASPSRA